MEKMEKMEDEVLYSVQGKVCVITLNRPKKMNSISLNLATQLKRRILQAGDDPNVAAIIITGNGRGFCTGADLTHNEGPGGVTSFGKATYDSLMSFYCDMILSIRKVNKPVIGAINGGAAGAGASLALACDFRIMTQDAYILLAFINVGLVPDAGISNFLVSSIGYSRALEIALEGKRVTSERCLSLGLANKLVAQQDDLLPAALEWGERIASQPQLAVGLTKNAFQFASSKGIYDTIEFEAKMQQFCIDSEDFVEGVMAFREKRKPIFSQTSLMNNPDEFPRGTLHSKL